MASNTKRVRFDCVAISEAGGDARQIILRPVHDGAIPKAQNVAKANIGGVLTLDILPSDDFFVEGESYYFDVTRAG